MDPSIIILIVVIKAAVIFGGAAIARSKGRSALGWGIGCLFFNWIALLIIIFLPKVQSASEGVPMPVGNVTGVAMLSETKADANIAVDDQRLAQIARNIDAIFRTPRGAVAQFKNWQVLAPDEAGFKLYESLADYRTLHKDQDFWPEVTDPVEKKAFIVAAQVPLEAINSKLAV